MPADQTIDFVVIFLTVGMLVLWIGSVALGWIVKTYDRVMSHTMSSAGAGDQKSYPSSLETDARQTQDAPAQSKLVAEELLTVCRLMRAYGIKREEAQAAFMASGLPFNNNVWARALPPPPTHVTPVAGRPTDADFPYQPIDA